MKQNKAIATIGSKTVVDFPQFGIKNVPAKVDTGADASSIWASNINEKRGILSFSLFAPNSPYFTGEIIKAKDYQIRSIRNSFGNTEFRYKVKLNTVVEGRPIHASFTLANRANNRYPILIGSRTIQGKFLVDVSQSSARQIFKVLVIDVKSIKSVKKFFNNIQKDNAKLKFTTTTFNDLEFLVDKTTSKILIASTKQNINKFDFVFFKSVMVEKDTVAALASYLYRNGIGFMDRANLHYPLNNKLAQYLILQNVGIQVPKSIFLSPEAMVKSYKRASKYLGTPFVLKDIKASKGRNNFLIRNQSDFNKVYHNSPEPMPLIAQQFIPNDGDYRILVFGRRVRLIIHRQSQSDKTHLNNTSVGGEANLTQETAIPGFVRQMAIEAARSLNLEVSGVDMVQDKKSGIWYCLEVNHGPQITSGSFLDEKRAAFTDYILEERDKAM